MSSIGGIQQAGGLQAALTQQQIGIAVLNKVQSAQEQQGQAIAKLLESVPEPGNTGSAQDDGHLDVRV